MSHVFLSIPILDKPELRMMYSMYQAILSSKHKVRVFFNENDSLISRVRNVHISEFYNNYPECDYFMSLDSDIEIYNRFREDNIFDRLIGHNLDFVGGLYAIKKPGPSRCSSISIDGQTPAFDTGLKEMLWLSTGCWCLKRSAVQKMIEAYPELEYDGDDNMAGKKVYGLYIPFIYNLKKDDIPNVDLQLPFKKYLSEDWSACARWKAIGGKIYADTHIVLRHIGKVDYALYNISLEEREK